MAAATMRECMLTRSLVGEGVVKADRENMRERVQGRLPLREKECGMLKKEGGRAREGSGVFVVRENTVVFGLQFGKSRLPHRLPA